MSFPLANLSHYDLISVLNKMDFHSFANIRKTTSWLRDFVDDSRAKIKTQLHLNWITILEEDFFTDRLGGEAIPEDELFAVHPKNIIIAEISKERVLSIDFTKFPKLEKIEVRDLDKDAFSALLDKLDGESVPRSIVISVAKTYPYNDSMTAHPIFKKIKDINLEKTFESPDLSFLCANHGTITLQSSWISDISHVIQAIKMIAYGTSSTTYIEIEMFNGLEAVDALIDMPELELDWSEDIHNDSHFEEWDPKLLDDDYAYLSIPVAGGKVGGLCVGLYGYLIRFKVFDTMQEYLDRIPLGNQF